MKMVLEKSEITAYLPQRDPFLMVDRVVEFDAEKGIAAELDLPERLPFFRGHFPSMPIMPGVMIAEALAQTCGLYIALSARARGEAPQEGRIFFLAAANLKFKSVVRAGERLSMRASFTREYGGLHSFSAEAFGKRGAAASGTVVLASGENVRL